MDDFVRSRVGEFGLAWAAHSADDAVDPEDFRIDYECVMARGEEPPLVDIRISARLAGPDGDSMGDVAWLQAWRFASGCFTFGDMDPAIGMAADGISHEAYLPIEQIYAVEAALVRRYDKDAFVWDPPAGLILVEDIGAIPAIRGTGIALGLLRELRAVHAGISMAVAMTACPIRVGGNWGPGEFARARQRLVRHYRSDRALELEVVSPRREPSLLTAFWSGSDEVPPERPIVLDAARLRAVLVALAAGRDAPGLRGA